MPLTSLANDLNRWWRSRDSNSIPTACKTVALPDELQPLEILGGKSVIRTQEPVARPRLSKPLQLTSLAIFLNGYRLRVPTMAQSCPRFTRTQPHRYGSYAHLAGCRGGNLTRVAVAYEAQL